MINKLYRINVGNYEVFMKKLPEAIANKKFGLIATGFYNCIGSLPITFALMNTVLATYFAFKSMCLYAATIFQFTPVGVVLAIISRFPPIFLLISYGFGVLDTLLLNLGLRYLYKDDARISKKLRRNLKYAPYLPLILWLQAIINLVAMPVALYKVIMKKGKNSWEPVNTICSTN